MAKNKICWKFSQFGPLLKSHLISFEGALNSTSSVGVFRLVGKQGILTVISYTC